VLALRPRRPRAVRRGRLLGGHRGLRFRIRFANVDLKLLLLLLRLQFGDPSFLRHDGLPCRGLGQRALLFGFAGRAVDLSLVAGLLDARVADGQRDLRLGRLLPGNRLPIGVRSGNARILLNLGLMGHSQVLDVLGRAANGLDLEAVDDKPERLHFL
jgi:hypothetical protein